ncbi:MAG: hypothetical protein J6I55_10425 [Ruminococcus sp.]|nr:hypothetical protein [Ruminococcus sp.]
MRSGKPESSPVVKLLRNFVLVLTVVMFGSIVLNFRTEESPTETALMDEAVLSTKLKGVFIRNEEPVTYSGNGVLSYNVNDSGKVGMGTVIAQVYPDDTQIAINSEIERLQRKLDILKKIQNPGTLESAQPGSLSESIEENYRSLVYARDMKDYASLENIVENILIQMSTYQIITDEVENFDGQVSDINIKLDELKKESVKPAETITSSKPAYFVSYCDGYEDIFSIDKLPSVTISMLDDAVDEKSKEKNIVGKLIDGYHWYLAGVIDNSRHSYNVGDNVKLRFESSADTFDAQITEIRDEGDTAESIIIAECSQFNYDLVQHRTENAEIIKGVYSGLKIPREAIRFADVVEVQEDEDGNEVSSVTNYKGVYISKGEQVVFKKIDVIYEGGNYVLSAVHDDDASYLALYDDIMIEGVDSNGE